tara:strand:- start:160 stop:435 length:276 start_codon:yes stop_codon:yes gene_type:complete
MKEIELAIAYLESFIECDSILSHNCADCGNCTEKKINTKEVFDAIKILKSLHDQDVITLSNLRNSFSFRGLRNSIQPEELDEYINKIKVGK